MLMLRADSAPISVSIGTTPRTAPFRRTKRFCPPTFSQHFDVALLSVQVHNRLRQTAFDRSVRLRTDRPQRQDFAIDQGEKFYMLTEPQIAILQAVINVVIPPDEFPGGW